MGHEIMLDIEVLSKSKVLCSEFDIKQSFLNVIMNAIDAMEDIGGTLTIRVYNDEDNSYIVTDIIDTGIGISEENLGKIFDKRFTTKKKGTGLGLSIAKNCVEKAGGSLKLTSELNVGTKVQIHLPIYEYD